MYEHALLLTPQRNIQNATILKILHGQLRLK